MKWSTQAGLGVGRRNSVLVMLFATVPLFALAQHQHSSPPPRPALTPHASAPPHTSAPWHANVPAHNATGSASRTPGPGSMGGHSNTGASNVRSGSTSATMHAETNAGILPGGTSANTRPVAANGHAAANMPGHTGNTMVNAAHNGPPAHTAMNRTLPGREVSLRGGGTASVRPNGQIRSISRNGIQIQHGIHGGRTIVSSHNGARVVTTGRNGGYVQRNYVVRNGNTYVSRTYVVNNLTYTSVYRSYSYGGYCCYYAYTPAYYWHPVYYGWAYNPWPAPVYYGWGWTSAAWYGYYGPYYYSPYPVYPSAAFWITDWMIAASLQASYEASVEVGELDPLGSDFPLVAGLGRIPVAPDAPRNVMLTKEIKDQLAEQIKTQLAADQAEASKGKLSAPSSGGGTVPALDSKWRTFIVHNELSLVADGDECSLTEGDVISRVSEIPDQDKTLDVKVLASKKNDCGVGKQVGVSLDDLEEMHNHFREQVTGGMKELANKQGTGGLPKAPDTGTQDGEVPPPAPDSSAAQTLKDQQAEADKTEADVKQEAASSGGGSK